MKDLSIYLHVPFCIQKCRYCDFLSYPASEEEKETYLGLLLEEIARQAPLYKEYQVISVFIGGGTPSILDGKAIEDVLCKLRESFQFKKDSELTIEVNPGTVTEQKLTAYLRAGINRLSIGLQTTDDEELRTLGRIHDYCAFCRTYDLARKMGFENINIDLISAIPGQTIDSYRDTLKKVLALEPEHISAYSLILEEDTWFYEHRNELVFPTEEEDRQLYQLTEEMLAACGYHRYEISNYAKDGYECVHNKVYWKRGNYLGIGLGAASMVEDVRWSNVRTMKAYQEALQKPGECYKENIQFLTEEEEMEEFMFLGLRLMKGVEKRAFEEKFGIPIEAVYGKTIAKLQRDGLVNASDFICLTAYGIDVSNYVMAQFLLG